MREMLTEYNQCQRVTSTVGVNYITQTMKGDMRYSETVLVHLMVDDDERRPL